MRAVLIHDRYSRGGRLVKMLEKIPDIEMVTQSENIGDVPELCTAHTPDLLIMNTFSKTISSLEYISYVKQNFPDVKVFVMTGAKDDDLAIKAKKAGADIVARKNLSLDELIHIIRYSQKHYRIFANTQNDPQAPD